MSKKTILFFIVASVTILSLAVIYMAYAKAPTGSSGASGSLDLGYEPGELLVRFAPKPDGKQRTPDECNSILTSIYGGRVEHSYKLVPGLKLVKLPENVNVESALVLFKKTGGILYAHPNYIVTGASTFPDDPQFGNLWGMHNIGQFGGTENADIDAPEAWDIKTDTSDIIVAVIDSGVDYEHEDLSANMWINPGEIPDNGIDDDGNELIDDVYGYDFCTRGQVRDSDPMDENGHGTHCAGTIGAVGNNNVGVTGVCWNVKIMALRFIDNTGNGNMSDAIACIQYASDMGAKVSSNSWGSDNDPQGLSDAIAAAGANGMLFVAAANNFDKDIDQFPFYPASYSLNNIISVMATDWDDNRADWEDLFPPPSKSNYGAVSVDLAAPGKYILSCWLGGDYIWGHGTSMATPHVAGACALLWATNPLLSHIEVKGIILNTVDVKAQLLEDPDPLIGRTCVTGGRLNLNNAVREAVEFPTDDGIVGWWKLNEGTGDIAYDSVGDNDGTIGGFPYDPAWNNDPDRGWCLDFDMDIGEQDEVSLSPVVALMTDSVTISAWIRPENTATQNIFTQYSGIIGYRLYLDTNFPNGVRPRFGILSFIFAEADNITVNENK